MKMLQRIARLVIITCLGASFSTKATVPQVKSNDLEAMSNITKKLSENVANHRNAFFTHYNALSLDTRKQFAPSFFTSPNGYLSDNKPVVLHQSPLFFVSAIGNNLEITSKITNKLVAQFKIPNQHKIQTSGKSVRIPDTVEAMAFGDNGKYLAVSYHNAEHIDIFEYRYLDKTFVPLIRGNNAGHIIGLKFITSNNKTYLFFLDDAYNIRVYNLATKSLEK